MQAKGNLFIIDFYYLLRCGKYTASIYILQRNGTLNQAICTNYFTVGNVGFWKYGCQLLRNSSLHLFLQADSATLKITNQNNSCMGQTIHHNSFASNICPCKALSRYIHHILSNGGDTEPYIF